MKISSTNRFPSAFILLTIAIYLTGCSGSSSPVTTQMNDDEGISNTNTSDSMVETTTVYFDINVPAFQSNELLVLLYWGDYSLTANWIGDELWQVTADFPANTEQLLRVTFFDKNGALELASYERTYRTGINASDNYQIDAEQFDADLFDADGDGQNNLSESIDGTDPEVDESSSLEIRETLILATNTFSVTQELEGRLIEQRPYTESFSEFIPAPEYGDVGNTIRRDIEIDSDGNATVLYSQWAPWYRETYSGTRVQTQNSISWEGAYTTYDGDYSRARTYSNQVVVVDQMKRLFSHQLNEEYSGTYRDTWDTSSSLVGDLIEDTNLCRPVSGSLTVIRGTNRTGFPFSTTTLTVTKEPTDPFWRVVFINQDSEKTEYLARELKLVVEDENGRDFGSVRFSVSILLFCRKRIESCQRTSISTRHSKPCSQVTRLPVKMAYLPL